MLVNYPKILEKKRKNIKICRMQFTLGINYSC
jgi:hypothetical protein